VVGLNDFLVVLYLLKSMVCDAYKWCVQTLLYWIWMWKCVVYVDWVIV